MKNLCSLAFVLFLFSCGGAKMPKEQYDQVYSTDGKGFPEYLLVKKINDSTISYLFFPEEYEMSCELQKKGTAVNQFFKRGPDIEIQKDGSGIETRRYTGDNFKCSLVLTIGLPEKIKVHGHCNGGNNCPEDAVYVLSKE